MSVVVNFRKENLTDVNDWIANDCYSNTDIELMSYKTFEPSIQSVSNLLGIETLTNHCIGWTISIPDKAKIPLRIERKMRSGKITHDTQPIAWTAMTNHQQVTFLMQHYVPHVVTPFVDRGIIIPEVNKNGNIHLHILAYDEDITDEYDLRTLQRSVGQCLAVRKFSKNNIKNSIHQNYIHYLKDPIEWIKYLQKDREFMNNKDYTYHVFTSQVNLVSPRRGPQLAEPVKREYNTIKY